MQILSAYYEYREIFEKLLKKDVGGTFLHFEDTICNSIKAKTQ